jgi:molybdenum cofactor biosynthesis enzyme MoaA
LHAQGSVHRRLRLPAAGQPAVLRGNRAHRPRFRRPRCGEDPHHRWRTAAAQAHRNLIERLAKLPVEITLTTNGSLLAKKARALKDAGLHRVTVSLDGIDDNAFKRMNDVDYAVGDVLDGIAAASAVGLAPIKVNCVVKRGANDDQVLPLARHFRHSGHILRFIEYMDVGSSNGWRMDEVLPSAEVMARIGAEFPLEPIDPNYSGEVAERWRYVDGGGEIGVISSVTQAFCLTCTRIRLSTEGLLYTCLFAQSGHDLRALLRRGGGDEALRREFAASGARATTAIPRSAPRQPPKPGAKEDRNVLHRRLNPPVIP